MDELLPIWLQAIVENAEDAIIILDQERIVRYANSAAARLADTEDPEHLIGTSYDKILSHSRILDEHGNLPDPAMMPTYRAFAQGELSRDVVLEQIYHDTHHWISVSCVPLFDQNGKVAYAVVYFSDISNRKLREDKLHFLVESSKILSITTDFNTRLQEKMRLAVPTLADWATVNVVTETGELSRIAIAHRDPVKIPLVAELAELSEQESSVGIYSVLRSGKPQFTPIVTEVFLQAGAAADRRIALARQLQVCSSMSLPIFSRGEVVGVFSLAFAESGRHYTDEDLHFFEDFCHHLGILIDNARTHEEVRKRDATKDTFLATLSHELRNPLAPIRSHLELLRFKTDQSMEDDIRIIEHQFNHLTRLLSDLLDVSRYSLGKINLERERVALNPLLTRIIAVHQPLAREKEISLAAVLPSQDIILSADPTRLEQAITNILHNAEKFTPPGGSITVATERTGDEITISIRDSGVGIDPNDLMQIFDIHAPLRSKREPGQGLGIGLVLVAHIAELHNGRVSAHSTGHGKGSEFHFTLPIERMGGHSENNDSFLSSAT